jgi:hypothetical protein
MSDRNEKSAGLSVLGPEALLAQAWYGINDVDRRSAREEIMSRLRRLTEAEQERDQLSEIIDGMEHRFQKGGAGP